MKPSKRASKSPVKRLLQGIVPLFPRTSPQKAKPVTTAATTRLESLGDDKVRLAYHQCMQTDLCSTIDCIIANRWSELCTLHSQHHTADVKNRTSMTDLLFLLSGLGMRAKADIVRFRAHQFPASLVSATQLYAIYLEQGPTFVDREIERCVETGKVRRFVIANASPVILRSLNAFQRARVTYGSELVEVLCRHSRYLDVIDEQIGKAAPQTGDPPSATGQSESLLKFRQFVSAHPRALYLDSEGTLSRQEIGHLVSCGLITLSSNHLNEIESHQYSIAYPGCGSYLRLVNAARAWLVAQLTRNPFHECLQSVLASKWDGQSKCKSFHKPFYGYDFVWVLADALGAGIVLVFHTPQGNALRLTGKV